jgi:hypothetical protein
VITTGGTYTTTFPLTENPISEGGKWINGGSDGLNWNNFRTTPGACFAAAFSSSSPPPYNDALATLKSSALALNANQFVEATIHLASGYLATGTHEMGIWLRSNLSAHDNTGYEFYWGQHGSDWGLVRNFGPNNFSFITTTGAGPGNPADGDVIRMEIRGSTLTVFKNGAQVLQGSDTNVASGQAGMGSYVISGNTPSSYCFSRWQCGSL